MLTVTGFPLPSAPQEDFQAHVARVAITLVRAISGGDVPHLLSGDKYESATCSLLMSWQTLKPPVCHGDAKGGGASSA